MSGAGAGAAPTVSVVIPVKDDAEALARCLGALRAQSRPPDQLIVVDNGSSDGSAAVALAAGAHLVFCDEPGIPAASARGYDAATGDLILRLDADCVPGPDWIERMLSAFAQHPDAGALTGRAVFAEGPRFVRRALAALYLGAYFAATWPALGHWALFGSDFGMRRDAWRDVAPSVHRHRDDIHDDLDLAFHLGERHRIRFVHGMPMAMSVRPFASASSFRTRFVRGVRTVVLHWPDDFPPRRWARLRAAARSRDLQPWPG
ncbi:glycosyltransferase family A protein [Microbacterium sp. NPDC019599]|uniref:glycosyltransferase family A protein n=1 Tax=Microbacterium sp. NPDC019599 TaxID=3154690 RepID=UPI00340CB666